MAGEIDRLRKTTGNTEALIRIRSEMQRVLSCRVETLPSDDREELECMQWLGEVQCYIMKLERTIEAARNGERDVEQFLAGNCVSAAPQRREVEESSQDAMAGWFVWMREVFAAVLRPESTTKVAELELERDKLQEKVKSWTHTAQDNAYLISSLEQKMESLSLEKRDRDELLLT